MKVRKQAFVSAIVLFASGLAFFCYADYTVTLRYPNNAPAVGCNILFNVPGIDDNEVITSDTVGVARLVTNDWADSTWNATILDGCLPFTPPAWSQSIPATVNSTSWTVFP